MSDKTTPEMEHKVLKPDPNHADKPGDEECETDHCDFVNEKEPLNKNNIKASTQSLNKDKVPLESQHINSETGNTKLKKKNSYRVNKTKNNVNGNHRIFNPDKFHQIEDELKKRSGLSRNGLLFVTFLIVLLFVFFAIFIVALVLWPRNLHAKTTPICKTSACLVSSSQMLPMLNTNASECDDFEEYSCGTWLRNKHIPSQHKHLWNMKQQLSYKQKEKIRDLLTTITMPDENSFSWKLKTFYDSCMDLENIEAENTKNIQEMFHELGGWAIIPESRFKSASWDINKCLSTIHKEHTGTPFFKVDVVSDPHDAMQNILRISPAGLELPDKNFYFIPNPHESPILQAYKTYIKDMVQHLGVPSNTAKTFSNDIFSYQTRLAEIFPDSDSLQDLYHGYKKVQLVEIKKSATSLHLIDILSAKYPDAKITSNTYVLVPQSDYIDQVSQLISNSDRVALNKYIMWTLTSEYFPYISQNFRDTYAIYRKALYGEIVPLPRWEFCVETVQKSMNLGVAALLQNANEEKFKSRNVVTKVFSSVQKTIAQSYKHASWLDAELKDFIVGKIENLSLQIGIPEQFALDEYINEYYSKFYAIRNDFFRIIKSATEFRQSEHQKQLTNPAEETRWLHAVVNQDLSVSYIASANKVVVPNDLLTGPFFDPEYTLPVIYAHLGVELSQAILSSVAPWNILYGLDGAVLSNEYPAVNASIRVIADSQPCVQRAIDRVLQKTESTISNFTINSAMTKISAVRQTLKALKDALSHHPHVHQPAMEMLEPTSLFFVSYTQSVCSVMRDEYNQFLSVLGTLSDSALLKSVFRQSKEFTEEFSCSSSTDLYTKDSCPSVI